eukprot:scaffold11152_cov57-Phaeocystis_antarctica.AAC.3
MTSASTMVRARRFRSRWFGAPYWEGTTHQGLSGRPGRPGCLPGTKCPPAHLRGAPQRFLHGRPDPVHLVRERVRARARVRVRVRVGVRVGVRVRVSTRRTDPASPAQEAVPRPDPNSSPNPNSAPLPSRLCRARTATLFRFGSRGSMCTLPLTPAFFSASHQAIVSSTSAPERTHAISPLRTVWIWKG